MRITDTTERYAPFQTQVDAFKSELGGLHEGDIEALHRARVASRRLREWLPLLRLDGGAARKLSRRFRKVTRQLGTVRELDVLSLVIQDLAADRRYSPPALKRVGAEVADARIAARERLTAKLPLAKMERLARSVERAARHLAPDDERSRRRNLRASRVWMWALDARTTLRAARVQSAIETAGTVYVAGRLHGVRIAVKKLRYAAELLPAGGQQRAADIAVMKTAQGFLGRLHDLEVLAERVRGIVVALSPPDLTLWRQLGSLVHMVEDDCRQWHARYMHDRRKVIEIAERLGAHSSMLHPSPVARAD
jgi:CHAD domain-containing protein